MIIYEAKWICPETGYQDSEFYSSEKDAISACKRELERRKQEGDDGYPEPSVDRLEIVKLSKKDLVLRCLNQRAYVKDRTIVWENK